MRILRFRRYACKYRRCGEYIVKKETKKKNEDEREEQDRKAKKRRRTKLECQNSSNLFGRARI